MQVITFHLTLEWEKNTQTVSRYTDRKVGPFITNYPTWREKEAKERKNPADTNSRPILQMMTYIMMKTSDFLVILGQDQYLAFDEVKMSCSSSSNWFMIKTFQFMLGVFTFNSFSNIKQLSFSLGYLVTLTFNVCAQKQSQAICY